MKKLVLFLMLLSSISLTAQAKKDKKDCRVEMNKKDIFVKTFDAACAKLKKKTIISFKIKVPNYKTVFINSNLLNEEAAAYVSKANIGDIITIFDIELKDGKKASPIAIKVIE